MAGQELPGLSALPLKRLAYRSPQRRPNQRQVGELESKRILRCRAWLSHISYGHTASANDKQ
ncbi:MAG: hypothetical protein CM15mP120_15050 [Pseudomonadota bacterium]|nr:MAG: hypothetical protein CM15mP120_15050 [Pseudomonadota bacterium]